MTLSKVCIACLGLMACLFSAFTFADDSDLEGIRVMALSPADDRAVVKLPAGALQVVKAGDAVVDNKIVSQILASKLVLRDLSDDGRGETIWVHLATGNKASRIQRFLKQLPEDQQPEPIIEVMKGS